MKRIISLLLIMMLLCACAGTQAPSKETEKVYGADFAERVADAWKSAGYLDDMTPYSEDDLLDYYGIDLSACRATPSPPLPMVHTKLTARTQSSITSP